MKNSAEIYLLEETLTVYPQDIAGKVHPDYIREQVALMLVEKLLDENLIEITEESGIFIARARLLK